MPCTRRALPRRLRHWELPLQRSRRVCFRRYANEMLLSYDSDGAGVKAALRAIGILKEAGLTGRVINLEPYKDPG